MEKGEDRGEEAGGLREREGGGRVALLPNISFPWTAAVTSMSALRILTAMRGNDGNAMVRSADCIIRLSGSPKSSRDLRGGGRGATAL